jgi:hypothetical protein
MLDADSVARVCSEITRHVLKEAGLISVKRRKHYLFATS